MLLVVSFDCRKTIVETENRRLDRSNRVWRKCSNWFSNYSCLIARPSFCWLLHALRWSVTNSYQCDAFSSRWQCRCHGSTDHWESLDCHCRTLWSRMPLLTETADSGSFVHSWAYSLRFVEADRKPPLTACTTCLNGSHRKHQRLFICNSTLSPSGSLAF